MLPAILAVTIAVVADSECAAAQQASFAGRWTEIPAAAPSGRGGPRAGDMGSGWGTPLTITQDASRVTVEYAFFGRGDMQAPLKFVYLLDGRESVNTVMMGRGMDQQRARATWNGNALVITTLHDFQDPATGKNMPVEVKRELSLSADTLVIQTTRAGVLGAQATSTRTRYTRAQQ